MGLEVSLQALYPSLERGGKDGDGEASVPLGGHTQSSYERDHLSMISGSLQTSCHSIHLGLMFFVLSSLFSG